MTSSRLTIFIILSLILHAGVIAAIITLSPGEVDEHAQPLMVGVTTQNNDPGAGNGNSLEPAPLKKAEPEKKAEKTSEKKPVKIVVKKTPAKIPQKNEIPSRDNNPVNNQTTTTSAVSSSGAGESDNVSPNGTATESGIGNGGSGLDSKGSGRGTEIGYPNYGLNPKPKYPQIAKRHGYEGLVILNVLVLKNGKVGKVEIRKSSGYDVLDNSALDAVKSWVFIPGKRNGHPMSSWVVVPIRFDLTNG
jgi:periplasmic protein TonB